MEHIGKTIRNLNPGTDILDLKTTEVEGDKQEELRKSLGVSSLENTFDNFKPIAGTKDALSAFKELAGGKTGWKMLLCYGGVGNGKTHLCEATAIELYKRGKFCRVLTMDKMMAALKESMGAEKVISLEDLVNNYSYTLRLIVDDVEGTPWEFEQLEKIIRVRYHENLFTILTTNRDLTELPERLVSRFRDAEKGRVILNSAEDYRPEVKK